MRPCGGKKEKNTGGNGAGFERRDGERIKEEKKCIFLLCTFFFFVVKKKKTQSASRWRCGVGWGDNGVISPIRKSSEGIVAPLTAVFFVLPHFINQQPEAGSNQLSRLAARSFVPAWQSEKKKKRNRFTTFMPLPDIINRAFVFLCYYPLHFLPVLICSCKYTSR